MADDNEEKKPVNFSELKKILFDRRRVARDQPQHRE